MVPNLGAPSCTVGDAGRDDARRREASVAAAGAEPLCDAHRWQEEVFGLLTEDWTEEERAGFHRAMVRLLDLSPTVEP